MTTTPSPPRIRVAALIVREGRVLVVEHTKEGRRYHLLPGGGQDPGESMAEALTRELVEELDLAVDLGDLALVTESKAPDGSRHVVQVIFEARARSAPRVTGQDPRVTGVRWLGPDEVLDRPFHPDIGAWLRDRLEGRLPGSRYARLTWT